MVFLLFFSEEALTMELNHGFFYLSLSPCSLNEHRNKDPDMLAPFASLEN